MIRTEGLTHVAAGGRLVERGQHAPGVEFASIADPDGYLVEL